MSYVSCGVQLDSRPRRRLDRAILATVRAHRVTLETLENGWKLAGHPWSRRAVRGSIRRGLALDWLRVAPICGTIEVQR